VDLGRGTWSRITYDPDWDFVPVWSPDGSQIIFSAFRIAEGGTFSLRRKAASGAEPEEIVVKGHQYPVPTDWSRDGRFIAFNALGGVETNIDIWMLSLTGDGKPFPYLKDKFNECCAQFAPDSKWVAYVSDETGRPEVYVQAFPTLGGKIQVSSAGGEGPRWRGDGKEIFYIGADRKLTAVTVNAGKVFESGIPRPLFETQLTEGSQYTVTADGQRFLLSTIAKDQSSAPITIVINWPAGLKR
jgi:eukaryotic-like serine/threonine-protein kinase